LGIEQALSDTGFMAVCVVSLTTEGDLLSQWRAYGGCPSGFAIGLRANHLREVAHEEGFYLAKSVYTPGDQELKIAELIEEFIERMTASLEWSPRDEGGCVATATRLAGTLKDDSFAEESEWRLISKPKMASEIDFRQGRSILVPYFKFPLGSDRNAYLDSIRIGPTPHTELAVASAEMLLLKLGLAEPKEKVARTRIPYRDW
jgi:hypothetical protein